MLLMQRNILTEFKSQKLNIHDFDISGDTTIEKCVLINIPKVPPHDIPSYVR